MLEITYFLTFFVSCLYGGLVYFLKFFTDYTLSPIPFGILMVFIICYHFIGKTWGYKMTTNSFKNTFLKLLAGFYLPLIAATMLYDGDTALPALSAATPYIIVFLTSSVLLLQLLRHSSGARDRKVFEKYQRKQALAFFAVTFLGTVGHLFELILYVINAYIIKPVGYLIFALMSGTSQIVEDFQQNPSVNDFQTTVQDAKDALEFESLQDVILENRPITDTIPNTDIPFQENLSTIVTVVLAIVSILILILILKNLSKERRKTILFTEEREDSTEEYISKTTLKKHFAPPDIQIRYYYKEFMKKSESDHRRVAESDTTADIRKHYLDKQADNSNGLGVSDTQTDASAALTDLYRKTRYSTQAVNKEDVATMKKWFKSCS